MNVKANEIARKRRRRRNPTLITAAQAATSMGLSRNSILWNIRRGYLKAHYDGYRYRIHLDDLKEFRDRFY